MCFYYELYHMKGESERRVAAALTVRAGQKGAGPAPIQRRAQLPFFYISSVGLILVCV